jgi:predicted DNA-binding transcriptional regulator YafY
VAEKRPLRILYIGEKGESWQIVTPHYVTDHLGVTHVVAYSQPHNKQQIFRLDRIFHAEFHLVKV